MELLKKILAERPAFHRSETEVQRSFDPAESYLSRQAATKLTQQKQACYGIERKVALFLWDEVAAGNHTLETGAGISTLIFAMRGATHQAITPNKPETEAIRRYAAGKNIPFEKVKFVIESSDSYLPKAELPPLDLVFLDGKHAFPWPIVDWFYTADRLKKGGLMVLDDTDMPPVKVLADFLQVDTRWQIVRSFDRTIAFRKMDKNVHDVAWHMQPWVTRHYNKSLLSRLKKKVKRLF